METLPSKELLSELGFFVHASQRWYVEDNYLTYQEDDTGFTEQCINIYELMHMMKEWALKNYSIALYSLEHSREDRSVCNILEVKGFGTLSTQYGNSEFEAVTKACEWILEQQK